MTDIKYKIGDFAEIKKVFRDVDIKNYAMASGDSNPIHMDDEYAMKTIFSGRIVQGMLVAGLISSVVGTKLPGEGTIYLSQI
jgi:3-hydroxybutyryl-CoA dehydratase